MLEGHSQFSSSEPSLQAKSPSHNRFFLTHSPLLHVNLSSLHLKPGRKSWKVCFYSYVQQAYKFFGTKECIYIRKVFNSLRIGLRHQTGQRFIVLQKCSRCCKLLLFYHCSSCYCFRARGIVSVVCSIVLSKGSKPFMWDLMRAATWPLFWDIKMATVKSCENALLTYGESPPGRMITLGLDV